jgi:hypothetical protein
MDQLSTFVGQAVTFFTGVAVLYFYVGLVMNLCQAQISSSLGSRYGYVAAVQQAMSMVILLAIAVGAQPISKYLVGVIGGVKQFDAASALGMGKEMVKMVITIILSGSMCFMVVAAVYNGFMAQLAHAFGSANEVSTRMMTIVTSILAGIVTLVSVALANHLVDVFFPK